MQQGCWIHLHTPLRKRGKEEKVARKPVRFSVICLAEKRGRAALGAAASPCWASYRKRKEKAVRGRLPWRLLGGREGRTCSCCLFLLYVLSRRMGEGRGTPQSCERGCTSTAGSSRDRRGGETLSSHEEGRLRRGPPGTLLLKKVLPHAPQLISLFLKGGRGGPAVAAIFLLWARGSVR